MVSVYGVLVVLLMSFEEGAPNSKVNSLQDALWYVVATLTTVGYGDIYPLPMQAGILVSIFLLSSLGVYGFIIWTDCKFYEYTEGTQGAWPEWNELQESRSDVGLE